MEQTVYCIQYYSESKDKWLDTWFNDIEDYNEAFKTLMYCKSNSPHRSYRIDPPQPCKNVTDKTYG